MRAAPLVIGEYRGQRGRRLAAPRRPRRSWRRTALPLAAGVLAVAALAVGARWLVSAPAFAVDRVESGPYRFSDRAQVEAALAVCLGRNIWTLRRAEVLAACADLPWVREVRLQRRVPGTVRIELAEWQPLLAIACDEPRRRECFLVGDGRVLPLPAHLTPPALPVLVGARLQADPGPGGRLADADATVALAAVAAMATTGLESVCPVDFVRLTDEGLVLVLQGRSGSLLVGREDFQLRLARYLLARPRIPEGSVVDLRFEDRITYVPAGPARS
jgi:hypothetical protein